MIIIFLHTSGYKYYTYSRCQRLNSLQLPKHLTLLSDSNFLYAWCIRTHISPDVSLPIYLLLFLLCLLFSLLACILSCSNKRILID